MLLAFAALILVSFPLACQAGSVDGAQHNVISSHSTTRSISSGGHRAIGVRTSFQESKGKRHRSRFGINFGVTVRSGIRAKRMKWTVLKSKKHRGGKKMRRNISLLLGGRRNGGVVYANRGPGHGRRRGRKGGRRRGRKGGRRRGHGRTRGRKMKYRSFFAVSVKKGAQSRKMKWKVLNSKKNSGGKAKRTAKRYAALLGSHQKGGIIYATKRHHGKRRKVGFKVHGKKRRRFGFKVHGKKGRRFGFKVHGKKGRRFGFKVHGKKGRRFGFKVHGKKGRFGYGKFHGKASKKHSVRLGTAAKGGLVFSKPKRKISLNAGGSSGSSSLSALYSSGSSGSSVPTTGASVSTLSGGSTHSVSSSSSFSSSSSSKSSATSGGETEVKTITSYETKTLDSEASGLGCFKDSASNRDLPVQAGSGSMTIEKCMQACTAKKHRYFGLQSGTECWCGDSFGKHGPSVDDAKCDKKCSGNNSQYCGGALFNSVFDAGKH